MTKEVLIVGVGGFAGGALRYILSVGLSKLERLQTLPIGIMVINILDRFLIGVLYGYSKNKATTDPVLSLLLMTGILGGLTTFSTFSFKTVQLLQQNKLLKAAFYVVGNVGLGVATCYLGMRRLGN